MAYATHKSGGQGGKLGRSNMEHWTISEEIKLDSKKNARQEAKREALFIDRDCDENGEQW